MRVAAIIEARMGSKRLPGKVLKTVHGSGQGDGMPLLAVMVERVWNSQLIDTVVVATPDTPDNVGIWSTLNGCPDFIKLSSGPEDDVLSRVLKAAQDTKTDVIVELTADCPIIDPQIVDMCAGYFVADWDVRQANNETWDFVGNVQPRTWPRGMDVRVFSTKTLERVNEEVKGSERESYWREHVSPWIYDRPKTPYRLLNLSAPPECTYPDLNLSVDVMDDYLRVKGVIEALHAGNPLFGCRDALEWLAGQAGSQIDLNRPSRPAAWLADVVNA